MKRHWKRWLIGGIAVILLVVVGGPFIYIHFIEGKAPAPLHITNQPSTSSASSNATGASTPVDGKWTVTAGSQAGYRVTEVLFGQDNTAVGRTSSITGTVTIEGTNVTAGSFTADLTTVKSDRSQRDNQFQHRIMDTSSYPTATFTLTQPLQLGTLPADGVTITKQATGNLTLHGTTRPVIFQVTARRSGSTIQVSGSIPITFADYNISNPSFGPVTTQDHGTLEFLLDFVHA